MRLPDRIWVPAAGALVLALLFAGALLVRADGDASLLVHAAPPDTAAASAPGSLTVQPTEDGFDGQFFYRIGTAPWSTAETESGVTFDLPALRNARWGYGALAFVVSGGDPDVVPWALLGINVAAATALAALGGAYARDHGRHAGWGMLLSLWPGFAYSLSLDTSEVVASTFVVAGLLLADRRRTGFAALAFVGAVLVRDTTVVVPAGLAAFGFVSLVLERVRGGDPSGGTASDGDGHDDHQDQVDQRPTPAWTSASTFLCALPALVAFVGWQLLQAARFGELPLTSSGDNNLSAPLGGLADQLATLVPPSGGEEAFRLLSVIGLLALIVGGGFALWTGRRSDRGRLDPMVGPWLLATGVIVVLNGYLWSGATAFMRAGTEVAMISTLALVRWAPKRLLAATAAGLSGLWLLTAAAQVAKLG